MARRQSSLQLIDPLRVSLRRGWKRRQRLRLRGTNGCKTGPLFEPCPPPFVSEDFKKPLKPQAVVVSAAGDYASEPGIDFATACRRTYGLPPRCRMTPLSNVRYVVNRGLQSDIPPLLKRTNQRRRRSRSGPCQKQTINARAENMTPTTIALPDHRAG